MNDLNIDSFSFVVLLVTVSEIIAWFIVMAMIGKVDESQSRSIVENRQVPVTLSRAQLKMVLSIGFILGWCIMIWMAHTTLNR